MQKHEAYKALPRKISQQVLCLLDKNWQAFFKAREAYQEDPSKFLGRPRLPKYKDKQQGRNILIYDLQCGDIRKLGPLTIVNGQARYSGFGRVTKAGFEGTVGSQGELALRLAAPASKSSLGAEIVTHGTIDGNGTIRARQTSRGCSYDLVWRKEAG